MVDGQCSNSPCQSNPAGICWGGTGSGAFSAESFEVSSQSNCEGYVNAMKQASPMGGRRLQLDSTNASEPSTIRTSTNSSSHRSLQSRGSGADSLRNRQNGASRPHANVSVLPWAPPCLLSHAIGSSGCERSVERGRSVSPWRGGGLCARAPPGARRWECHRCRNSANLPPLAGRHHEAVVRTSRAPRF